MRHFCCLLRAVTQSLLRDPVFTFCTKNRSDKKLLPKICNNQETVRYTNTPTNQNLFWKAFFFINKALHFFIMLKYSFLPSKKKNGETEKAKTQQGNRK